MGCASSKVLGSEFAAEKGNTGFSKGISIPTHPQVLPNDFHIVALTSSTYGILKVDPPKLSEEDSKDGMGAHSVKDVLHKLNNLESKAEAAPQSWLEVSSMLENIKPDLEKPKSIKKPQQPDAIDINDIMLDLDEDTGLVRPKARKLANLKKAGKSLPIRTLEELDKHFGGKENSAKNGVSPTVSIADLRASLKPVGTARASLKPVGTARAMTAKGSMPQNNQQHKVSSVTDTRDGVIKKDSELVDDDFLGSYKIAFKTFSQDDWKVVEALCHDADSDTLHDSEDEKHVVCKEEDVGKSSSASEDIFFGTVEGEEEEEEENTSSSTEGNAMANSLSVADNASSKGGVITKKSPLEDFEELCPPGGKQAVVLYTTSLRGIRRTYEDCIKAREIVKSYGVLIDERDVSMHLEYRNELRELMQRVVTVPRLFVKGRYIGGAEVVAKLEEEGKLGGLLEGSTRAHGGTGAGAACDGCAGAKFVPCLECSGSCKVVKEEKQVMRCPDCNENGLIQCPICS